MEKSEQPVVHTAGDVVLEAKDLACERDGRLLFSALNMQLSAGTLLQVAGPNGSGKTSLLRLLSGLMIPTQGAVHLQGEPLRKHPERLAQTLLWIGHATGIKALMTAEENLSWLTALNQQVCSQEQIWQALASVGLRGFEDVPCHTLSAGQQRRVALARLYLNPPPVWILDEPFTALDHQAVASLEQRLATHCSAGGLVVFTTHHVWSNPPVGFSSLDLGQKAA